MDSLNVATAGPLLVSGSSGGCRSEAGAGHVEVPMGRNTPEAEDSRFACKIFNKSFVTERFKLGLPRRSECLSPEVPSHQPPAAGQRSARLVLFQGPRGSPPQLAPRDLSNHGTPTLFHTLGSGVFTASPFPLWKTTLLRCVNDGRHRDTCDGADCGPL